jgi:hypothetical protein
MHAGALDVLGSAVAERQQRLGELAARMEESLRRAAKMGRGGQRIKVLRRQREFMEQWPTVAEAITGAGEGAVALRDRDALLTHIHAGRAGAYLDAVRGLDGRASARGRAWLQKIVGRVVDRALVHLPSFRGTTP